MLLEKLNDYLVDQTLELSPEFIKSNASLIPLLFQVSLLSDVDVRVEKVSDIFLNFIEHITPYDAALVYIWDPQDAWFCRGLQGEIPRDIDKGDIFTCAIRDTARPVLVPDLGKTDLSQEYLPITFSSMIGLPIYKDTKIIGCLELFRKEPEPFSINDIILIKHLLLSSENILKEVLNTQPEWEFDGALDIRIDIPQRHVLLDVLHQYEELSKRLLFPVSIAIIEIQDREKFGLFHQIPERIRALKSLPRRIQEGLRCYDKVVRYDELSFFVILPGCTTQDAFTAVHNAVVKLGPDLEENVKIGIATLPDEAQDAKSLINLGHQALSHAKKKGLHIASFSQSGAMKSMNLSLELRVRTLLQSCPSLKAINELLDMLKMQCNADDVAIRTVPPGTSVGWEGYDLGYIIHEGLPDDIYEWIVSYVAPAWAVATGFDTDIRNWYTSILTTASILSDLRAGYPMGYSMKVSDQVYTLAKEMGKSDLQAQQWAHSSLSANIGYLGIATSIFTKGEITPFEKKKLNGHPIITSRILRDFTVLDMDADLLLYHHENLDGSGYPRGLKGEEIPQSARAMRVVDTFNAMTSPRLYKSQMNHEDALRELCSMSGKTLDPDVASLYVDIIGF
ncbi:MAG: HD domain-containing phosphohydrolase [Desulfomonilia bacterium]